MAQPTSDDFALPGGAAGRRYVRVLRRRRVRESPAVCGVSSRRRLPDMYRRDFLQIAGGCAAVAAAEARAVARVGSDPPAASRPSESSARMKVGTQHDSSDDTLAVLAALGVNNVCSVLPSVRLDEQWSVEGLMRLRSRVEKFGI